MRNDGDIARHGSSREWEVWNGLKHMRKYRQMCLIVDTDGEGRWYKR